MNESVDTYILPSASARYICMGWLWLIGSLKLQVHFAKEPYKRDDILQKRRIILIVSKDEAPFFI